MNYSYSEAHSVLELFNSGNAVHCYDIFGAHLVNSDGKNGVIFRVWAPNALSVSVVGDFNNWDNSSHFMTKTDNGIWELFVEGISAFAIYKYCIETPENEKILKADPYAFYAETAPNNASIVYSTENYIWNDENWLEYRKNRDKIKNPMNIYEMHLGSWKKNSDGSFVNYRTLADELVPYLQEMHYTFVQLMPLMEYPFEGSWGYQATGYFAATSRYGTPEDLMYFVDKLHQANIGIIIDWVPSNFPKDSFALAKFDGTALYESENPKVGERPSWGTYLFDYSTPQVVSFLISSAMFWIERYHIDGIRVGALSSMLYLDYEKNDGEWTPNQFGGKENLEALRFVKKLNSSIHNLHPDVIMFAEESTAWPKMTRPVEEGGLGFDYKWNMSWTNDMLHYMSLDPQWRPFNHDNFTYSFFYAFSEHFLLPISHDEVSHNKKSLLNKMPGTLDEKFAGVRAFIAYMYAHPGKKLIFMGCELGQFEEWDIYSQLQWNLLSEEKHAQLRLFFKDIGRFYLDNKPLYELDTSWKGFDWIHHDDYINSVIAFKRCDSDGNEIIAVCNLQPTKHIKYNIGVPKYGLYDEIFNSDSVEYGGSGITNGTGIVPEITKIHGYNQGLSLTLPPLGVIYLRCTQELEPPKSDNQ